jgi:hypothetical protein
MENLLEATGIQLFSHTEPGDLLRDITEEILGILKRTRKETEKSLFQPTSGVWDVMMRPKMFWERQLSFTKGRMI